MKNSIFQAPPNFPPDSPNFPDLFFKVTMKIGLTTFHKNLPKVRVETKGNQTKHKENKAKMENTRFLRFSDFADFSDFF